MVTEPECACADPECETCNEYLQEFRDEQEELELNAMLERTDEAIEDMAERGGDAHDHDEEDMHGSGPIDAP